MGFLHNLWDETLAGPTPDSGIGKLRKYKSLRVRSGSNIDPSNADDISPVSRSITILRSNSLSASSDSGSSPSSPSTPVTPGSTFSPTSPGGNIKKLTRAKSTAGGTHSSRTKHPTGYDWIVLSALDR
ncbi:dormancy-associated protein homolog 4 [Lactuca sativa]|uniref:dormancy-associated protein homolog 4 n=1 Tax=Lactuca sativa TaxID=4236 RepID=UPI000CB3F770|nr:dormancy-associated protein homolog 4 [Lactuca sativa]